MGKKIRFCILDVYPNNNHRICKDTAGGYGTGNNFGSSFFSKALSTFTNSLISQPSMYVGYVLSIINNTKNAEVSYERSINTKVKEADFIILCSSIVAHETEIETLNYINDVLKKKIFVVGIFSNIVSEPYLKENSVIIEGEPENFFLKLVYEFEKLNNYFTNSNKKISAGMVNNLDELPFPQWDYYLKKYKLKNHFLGYNFNIAIPLLATRGCPYSCFNYCTYPLQQGRKVRFRSAKNIVEEIKYWNEKIKKPKFVFRDPVFSINRKFTLDLCKEIINSKLNIEYLIETHLNNLDDELIDLLKSSGLKLVYVGVESKHEDVLADIDRFTIKEDKQINLIKKLEDKKIAVKSMFMIGNPADDLEKIKQTINYSKKLPNQLVQFSVFTPYPGTPIFKNFKNILIENKYEKFNQYNLIFKHKNFSKEDITRLKNLAYKSYYFRIKTIRLIFFFLKNLFFKTLNISFR